MSDKDVVNAGRKRPKSLSLSQIKMRDDDIKITNIMVSVLNEVDRAEKKHPKWPKDELYASAIVMEEAGELMRAAVQLKIDKTGKKEELRKEAIQTAAMCLRLLKNL